MRDRVLTAIALIPPVLAAVFCTSPWPILALLALICLVGISELHRLTGQVLAIFGLPFVLIAIVAPFSTYGHGLSPVLTHRMIAETALIAFIVGIISVAAVPAKSSKSNFLSLLHGGWLAGPLASLFALHQSSQTPATWHFASPVLLAILPLWAGDTAAIFAGKAFGKHKLAPTISPKKTVEGAVANLIACVLAAWGLGVWISTPLAPSLACGFAAGILGQAGDLFESWVKRRADMKDSGTLLPGHGGIMDRIDSILFTAPFVALILLLWK